MQDSTAVDQSTRVVLNFNFLELTQKNTNKKICAKPLLEQYSITMINVDSLQVLVDNLQELVDSHRYQVGNLQWQVDILLLMVDNLQL